MLYNGRESIRSEQEKQIEEVNRKRPLHRELAFFPSFKGVKPMATISIKEGDYTLELTSINGEPLKGANLREGDDN